MNIEEPEQLGPARETALQGHQPTGSQRWARATVLDIRCDPDVPPIPPHATFDQVKSVAGAILHGDADAWGFTKQGVKQKMQQYLRVPRTIDHEPAQTVHLIGRRRARACVVGHADRRFERTLAGLTAAGAAITAGEAFLSPRRGQLREQDHVVAGGGRVRLHRVLLSPLGVERDRFPGYPRGHLNRASTPGTASVRVVGLYRGRMPSPSVFSARNGGRRGAATAVPLVGGRPASTKT